MAEFTEQDRRQIQRIRKNARRIMRGEAVPEVAAERINDLGREIMKRHPATVELSELPGPLFGPFLYNLLDPTWDEARLDVIEEAADLGCDILGFTALPLWTPEGIAVSLDGADLNRVKRSMIERTVAVCEACWKVGIRPVVYLASWPSFRGEGGGYVGLNRGGKPIPSHDFGLWRNDARAGLLAAFVEILNDLPGYAWIVDGVEPFGHSMPPSPPLNAYQRDIAAIVQGHRLLHWQGGDGDLGRDILVPIQPGASGPENSARGGLMDTDGWGSDGGRTKWEDGRGFAGLPAGGTVQAVTGWFRRMYLDAISAGREGVLVLHTTNWPQENNTGGMARPIPALDVEPFGDVYRDIAGYRSTLESVVDAVDISDAIIRGLDRHPADVRGWPITAPTTVGAFREGRQEWAAMPASWTADYQGAQGCLWVGREIDGRVEIGAVEWFRHGMTVQVMRDEQFEIVGEWDGWRPKVGEELLFFLTSPSNHNVYPLPRQRSAVVRVRWGQ